MSQERKKNYFSEAEDVILANSVKQGLNVDEISEILNGRNNASIYHRIGYLVLNGKLPLWQQDITIYDVASFLRNNNYAIENNQLVRWSKEVVDINFK